MKKRILLLLVSSVLMLPFLSSGALATWEPPTEYDTGVKFEGTEGWPTLTWVFPACEYVCVRTDADIDYRHTTPPSARPGWIDEESVVVTTSWSGPTGYHAVGTCDAQAQFWSEINPEANHGVNHGDIMVFYVDDDGNLYDMFSWSFNVRHTK